VRALTLTPGVAGSADVHDVGEPALADGEVLVAVDAVGVCGTDREIVAGEYGQPPEGEERLVLGHESLGRVLEAPPESGFREGDRVVGVVRRPDPVPCPNCAVGEWDMCRNGRYTEHGIKGLHGFARERYRAAPDELVPVDPALGRLGVLLEPASVVAKAWEHTERIGSRATWAPQTVLVTGAGPIGLLAALLAVQRGLDTTVLDIVEDGPKPELVRALGAQYSTGPADRLGRQFDVVLECTGIPAVVAAVLGVTGPNGVVCLTGVSTTGRQSLDLGALNREWVLENDVVFGSVNANRRHYEQGAKALAAADRGWLSGLVRREVPVEDFRSALDVQSDDVKTVLTF
jgi:2-desacetyl-2-hydroxyethyl bacteriochlorophyllide A dehydrogenase